MPNDDFKIFAQPLNVPVQVQPKRNVYWSYVCLYVLTAFPHYCAEPGVTWGNGRGCPVVVHYWADLQSVHGFRCYDNIAPNASGPSCNEPQFSSTRNVSQCSYSIYDRPYLATMGTKTGTRVPSPGRRTTTNQWP